MVKKIVASFMVILFLGMSTICLAEGIISPFYTHTDSIKATLVFNGNGAVCYGEVLPSGSYDVSIVVTLYKQNGSNWDYVASWSGSAKNGLAVSAGGSKSIGSGTYKVTAVGNIGNGLEKPTKSVTKTK